ncbi:MAG: MaoC family dehydratase [Halobacteriaceae archaeon]
MDETPGYAGVVERMAESWGRSVGHLSRSVVEANRAAAAAAGLRTGDVEAPGTDEVAYGEADWTFERSVEGREELAVGDWVRFTKTLGDGDVAAFARATGDTNRLHLDEEYAEGTRFGGRIAHGTLVGGLVSAALARLPGLTIYLSQDLEFRAPARPGDRLTAVCEVAEELGEDRYRLTTRVVDADDEERTLVDGEAVVLIDERPDDPA